MPGDATASGWAPVAAPGLIRMAIKPVPFGYAAWRLPSEGAMVLGQALAAAVLLHYLVSCDRIAWLLGQ